MSDSPANKSAATNSSDPMTIQQTLVMLRAGVNGPKRPVDDLIARIVRGDGAKWLASTLQSLTADFEGSMTSEKALSGGGATLKQVEMLKDRGKKMLKSPLAPEDRLAGLTAYFFAIAAGLAHHGVLVGAKAEGAARQELTDVLLDLASVSPEPWSRLLGDAAMRVRK